MPRKVHPNLDANSSFSEGVQTKQINKQTCQHMLHNLMCHFFYKMIGPKMAENITHLLITNLSFLKYQN